MKNKSSIIGFCHVSGSDLCIKNNAQLPKSIVGGGKERFSNLELYRIICMMLIVAHHCVVNSGLDTVDCVGHYNLPPFQLVLYILSSVSIIFIVCTIIDIIRIKLVEKPFFRWYDKKPRFLRIQTLIK